MIAAKTRPHTSLHRPLPRRARRHVGRKLVPGFFGRAPRARTWSRRSQVADPHRVKWSCGYETAPGCTVAANSAFSFGYGDGWFDYGLTSDFFGDVDFGDLSDLAAFGVLGFGENGDFIQANAGAVLRAILRAILKGKPKPPKGPTVKPKPPAPKKPLSEMSRGELSQQINAQQRELLRKVFGDGPEGARKALEAFRQGDQIPLGLT